MNYREDTDATLNLSQGRHAGADNRGSPQHTAELFSKPAINRVRTWLSSLFVSILPLLAYHLLLLLALLVVRKVIKDGGCVLVGSDNSQHLLCFF